MIKIAPSVLSADFARLGDEIKTIAEADYIHFDVMDGEFVPNISIGIPVLKSVRACTDMAIDVHLMIDRPERYAEEFCKAGADILTFHVEASDREGIMKAIDITRECGKIAGLSVKPKTPAAEIAPFIDKLGLVLVMTVEPGFGGQKFMHDQLGKIAEVREMIEKSGRDIMLEVDGGVNPETAKLCVEAGADVLVAGSDVFRAENRNERIRQLRGN